jgi:hypothetical protein
MTPDGERVGDITANAVIDSEVFGCLDHSADPAESPRRLRHFAAAIEPIVQHLIAGPRPPPCRCGVVLDVAQRLHPAREHDVRCAGLHRHGRRDHGLQPATAAAIDL